MEKAKHIHLSVRQWVVWWFYIGIIAGVVALVNILFRDLTRSQDHVILVVGIAFWAFGGFVCWASDSVRWQYRPPSRPPGERHLVQVRVGEFTAAVLDRQWQRHDLRDAVFHSHPHHP